MALNFPAAPSLGDTHDATNGVSYYYDGTKWKAQGGYTTGTIETVKLDDIDSSFNGSTTTFNLKVNNSTVKPINAQAIFISLAGTIQEPGVAYTVNSTNGTITFASAPAAGTVFFGILHSRLPVDPGLAATVTVGSTTTGNAGTNASVTNSGTNLAATLNFTIPKGDTGSAGAASTVAGPTGPTGAAGAAGADGKTVLNGTGSPSGGSDGDFFIDTTNTRIYGPKAGGSWPTTFTSLKGNGAIDVRDYGATGDGSTDDTAAIQSALNAGSVFFPAGTYKITSTISLTDKIRSINGVGQESVLKFVPSSAPDNLFEITRTSIESAFFQVSNLRFDAAVVDAGYAIKIQETRTTTGTTGNVVGGVDFLHITDVIFDSDGSGYWRGALHQLNAGGTYWTNTSFRNNNAAPAQANTNVKAIWLQNTSPGGASNVNYKMIRCLHMNNFYIQRAYSGINIETTTVNFGIESVYMDLGEIIARTGIQFGGSGHIDAINVQNVHMDVLESALISSGSTKVNLIRIIGSDLRKGSNEGTTVAGNLIRFASGEILSIVGCQFGGTVGISGAPAQNGISLEGDYKRFNIDGGNFFRDLDSPIIVSGTVNNGTIGLFQSDCASNTVSITSSNSGTITQDGAGATVNTTNVAAAGAAMLTGATFTGSVTFQDAINENVFAITDGNAAIDPDNGTIQTWTLGANRTASDSVTAGQSVLLMITAGAHTLTFPTITWAGGSAPTLSTSTATAIEIWKVGSTLYGANVGDV